MPEFDRAASLSGSHWDGAGRRKRHTLEGSIFETEKSYSEFDRFSKSYKADFSPSPRQAQGSATLEDDIRFTRKQADQLFEAANFTVPEDLVDEEPVAEQSRTGNL